MKVLFCFFMILCSAGCSAAEASIYYNDDGSPDYHKINEDLIKSPIN